MALIDKASLLMVPSVYEDGTLYNVLPSGNKAPDETGNHNGYDQTRADFTFSRGSNLAATRVNANGLIEKGRENLLTYSKNLSSSGWTGSGCTSASAEDFEGGNNANQLTSSSANGFWYQAFSSTGVNTISIYAKAGTGNVLRLRLDSSTSPQAYFDLSNGTITNQNNNIDATITAVSGADGWYRCTLTGNISSPNNVRIYPTQDTNVIVYKVQLEKGLVATDYIETGSVSATAGVLENTPRIDYSSGAGSLKLEPQRTNLLPHSEYVEGNPLSNSPTITQNYAISPDGGKNAFRMQDVDANDFERFRYLGTESTLCMSLFVKKTTSAVSTYGGFGLNWSGGTSKNVYAAFDEYNGTIAIIGNDTGNAQVFVEDHDTYWRFALSATDTGSNTNVSANYYACISTNFTSPGLGLKDYTAYGAQLEATSYPSSYVPTYGSAATRGADACSVTGVSDVIGQTSGSFYAEVNSDAGGFRTISICDGSTSNRMTLAVESDDYIKLIPVTGGSVQTQLSTTYVSGVVKICCTYNASSYDFFVNGTKVGTGSRTAFSGTLDEVRFDQGNGGNQFFGDAVKMIVFDEELTDAEAVTLTTL